MAGYIGSQTPVVSNGSQRKYTFTATAAQTVFTGMDIPNPQQIQVFQNGVRLVITTDYTVSSGTTVTLVNAASAGDSLVVILFADYQLLDQDLSGDFSVDSPTFVVDSANNRVGIGTTSLTGKAHIYKSSVNNAIIGTSYSGHYFESQSDDATDGFEIYQQHGSNTTRNSFIVNDNRTGSKSAAFVVRGDGKVGISTSSPNATLDVSDSTLSTIRSTSGSYNLTAYQYATGFAYLLTNGQFEIGTSGSNLLLFKTNNTERLRIDTSGALNGPPSANFAIKTGSGTGDMQFFTNGSQRATIDSSGNVLVGVTSSITAGSEGIELKGDLGYIKTGRNNTGSVGHFLFYNPNGNVGSITTSGSSTAFNTSSDHRLKEDVQPMTGASDRVLALNPVNFAWKVDGSRVDGFLAHEAQAIVPEAVTGTHNEVDDDGNAVMQGIDQSKLVPLLTAALKEAITKIEALETEMTSVKARLDALEGN